MSILDVFKGGSIGSVIQTLAGSAESAVADAKAKAPGGLGGLLGAGALGALFGSVASKDLVKNAALLGAGAAAWNFYKKWSADKAHAAEATAQTGNAQQPAVSGQTSTQMPAGFGQPAQSALPVQPAKMQPDATATLIMRAIIYSARADGNIDATEQQRIDSIVNSLVHGADTSVLIEQIRNEQIDPASIASGISAPEQAEDVYRLSCSVIDIDHFMERSYLDTLARALGISDSRKVELENEATQMRGQLAQAALN